MTVIAPKGCKEYLTEGKEYEVINIDGSLFTIRTEYGILICLFKGCSHLDGGDWIIKHERLKKYHVLFMREGENISTGITYYSETVTGALSHFFYDNPTALFLSVSSEDLFNLKF